tara:strand:- start:533 stop:760 length:228 start_codon:yes stop_codon:yes gene_type:complete
MSNNKNSQKNNESKQERIEKSKKVGKEIQKTLGPLMDDKNKEIVKVWAEQGDEKAVKTMMENAGNDYGRMRSMYG